MTDRPCETCGHPIIMGRCWRLTCPTNGGTGEALALLEQDLRLHGIAITKGGERIAPEDFYRPTPDLFGVDNPDNAPSKATAHITEDDDE